MIKLRFSTYEFSYIFQDLCSESKKVTQEASIPLAEKMRPISIISFIGQTHILGPESMLYHLLSQTEVPNIILWGPPGCGKVFFHFGIIN